MWNDRLRLAERVETEWLALTTEERSAALDALRMIDDDPIAGAPLYEPFRGYWSYRGNGIRVIYRVVAEARFVVILAIGRVAA